MPISYLKQPKFTKKKGPPHCKGGPETNQPLLERYNGNPFFISTEILEFHDTVHQGEQGVISTLAHVLAGVDSGSTLPNDDGSGQDTLTTVPLHAQILGV